MAYETIPPQMKCQKCSLMYHFGEDIKVLTLIESLRKRPTWYNHMTVADIRELPEGRTKVPDHVPDHATIGVSDEGKAVWKWDTIEVEI